MTKEEYAILLLDDEDLNDVDVVNLSGLSKGIEYNDIPGILYAIEVLRTADPRFTSVTKGVIQENEKRR